VASEDLKERAERLKLHGLVASWSELGNQPWVETLISNEEAERRRRSCDRRIRNARIGRFKIMADFDWAWPKELDREQVEDLFTFNFLDDAEPSNVVLVGPNGVGKTMIAQNLAHQAVLRGKSVRFVSASEMLNELASQDGSASLGRRLRRYARPNLLVIDEVGYLSYDSRHADLLFEVVNRRSDPPRSTVVTTNRGFKEWGEVFPNAACVVALVDRLIHRAEVVRIQGDSYRKKEAEDREARRAAERAARRTSGKRPKR
jgi:DNA replication protein DnaC